MIVNNLSVRKVHYNKFCDCGSDKKTEYEININDEDTLFLCRRCLLKLKRQIDDVVEKR